MYLDWFWLTVMLQLGGVFPAAGLKQKFNVSNLYVLNKLRLVMLYALRYQKTQAQNVASLINLMLENGVSREDARVRVKAMKLDARD